MTRAADEGSDEAFTVTRQNQCRFALLFGYKAFAALIIAYFAKGDVAKAAARCADAQEIANRQAKLNCRSPTTQTALNRLAKACSQIHRYCLSHQS